MSSEQKQEQPKSAAEQPTEQTTTFTPNNTLPEKVITKPIQYTISKPSYQTTTVKFSFHPFYFIHMD